jgi:hypothetical protein
MATAYFFMLKLLVIQNVLKVQAPTANMAIFSKAPLRYLFVLFCKTLKGSSCSGPSAAEEQS